MRKCKQHAIVHGIQRIGLKKYTKRHTYCVSRVKYKYDLGDLVICKYDFEYIYYTSYLQHLQEELFFMGVIVSIREEEHIIFFDRDVIYDVLCTDGVRRLFATWEIEVIRKGKKSWRLSDKITVDFWRCRWYYSITIKEWLRGGIGIHTRLKISRSIELMGSSPIGATISRSPFVVALEKRHLVQATTVW